MVEGGLPSTAVMPGRQCETIAALGAEAEYAFPSSVAALAAWDAKTAAIRFATSEAADSPWACSITTLRFARAAKNRETCPVFRGCSVAVGAGLAAETAARIKDRRTIATDAPSPATPPVKSAASRPTVSRAQRASIPRRRIPAALRPTPERCCESSRLAGRSG